MGYGRLLGQLSSFTVSPVTSRVGGSVSGQKRGSYKGRRKENPEVRNDLHLIGEEELRGHCMMSESKRESRPQSTPECGSGSGEDTTIG